MAVQVLRMKRGERPHAPAAADEQSYKAVRWARDDELMAARRGKRNAQVIALCTSLALLLAVAGLVTVSTQVRVRPFIVTENTLGELVPVAGAREVTALTRRQYTGELGKFIRVARSVLSDKDAQQHYVDTAYAYVTDGVANSLNSYYKVNNPWLLAEEFTRTVRIQSVSQIGEETWQLRWIEDRKARSDGRVVGSEPWIGTVAVKVDHRRTDEVAALNSSGLTVTRLDWSAEIAGNQN